MSRYCCLSELISLAGVNVLDLLRRSTALSIPVLLAAALVSVPAAGPAAAAAASSPRWRIVKLYGPKASGGSQLMSVYAAGQQDAWLAGVVGVNVGAPAPLVAHWNGRSWRAEPTPPGTSSATAPMVFSNPQNVPRRPRKISRPVM